jgi:hypothetical protein
MISRTQAATGSASMVPSTVRRGGRFEEAEILPGDLGWPELTRLGSLRGAPGLASHLQLPLQNHPE